MMTRHNLTVAVAVIAAHFTLLSCVPRSVVDQDDSGTEDRHLYAPEVNKVEVMILERTEFCRQVISNGRISASRRTALSFRTSGTVESVSVRGGQRVSVGDEIARLDATDRQLSLNRERIAFEKAQVDLMDALVGLGYSAGDTASVPPDILSLAKTRSGWSSAENNLKIAARSYDGAVLRTPISGVVADLSVKAFDQVGASPVCTILDDSSYEIDFPVLETELPLLRSATEVKVIPYSTSDATLCTGYIDFINPSVGKGGQITVRARIPGSRSLMDGMNAKVVIEQCVPDRLVVPKSAVVVRDNLDVLFRFSCGHAEWVYVRVLESSGECHSVMANTDRGGILHEGDTIIVSGNLNLADESVVELKK